MAAVSVHGVYHCAGLPQPLEDIANSARVTESRVANAYAVLNSELGLPTKPMTPKEYVPRLASEMDVPDQVRQGAQTLAEKAGTMGITTCVQPSGFAAACLYKAGQEQEQPLTQTAIADVANTSPATVQTHRDSLDDLFA